MCPSQLVPGTALVCVWRGSPCKVLLFECGTWDSNEDCLYSVLSHSPPLNLGTVCPASHTLPLERPEFSQKSLINRFILILLSCPICFFWGISFLPRDKCLSCWCFFLTSVWPGSMLLGSCVRTWVLPNFWFSVSATQNERRHMSCICFPLETVHLSLSGSELDVQSMQSATDVFFPYFWTCSSFGVFSVIPELVSTSRCHWGAWHLGVLQVEAVLLIL